MPGVFGVGSILGEQALGCVVGGVVGTTLGVRDVVQTIWLWGNLVGACALGGAGGDTVGAVVGSHSIIWVEVGVVHGFTIGSDTGDGSMYLYCPNRLKRSVIVSS